MYEVRQGLARTVGVLLLWSVVPGFLLALGAWNWPHNRGLFIVGVGLTVVIAIVVFDRVRRALRREVLFAIGADGVTLGPDDYNGGVVRAPWHAVDAVVHFRVSIQDGDDYVWKGHVGVVREGRIDAYRRVEGWTYDGSRASAAVHAFGGGVRLAEGPDQDGLPPGRPGEPIALPRTWVAAHTRQR